MRVVSVIAFASVIIRRYGGGGNSSELTA